MKTTSAITKLLISAVNVLTTFVLSLPFLMYYGFGTEWKLIWVAIFFIYNLIVELVWGRCVGMMFFKAQYESQKPMWQKIIYIFLYTASFSTLFFHIWFLFDILLINLLLVQLPCILLTGTTLHGLLSGNIRTALEKFEK